MSATNTPQVVGDWFSPDRGPMLLDGALMTSVAAGSDGMKHVSAASEIERWSFRIGLINGVSHSHASLATFDGESWIYMDASSRLAVCGFGAKYKQDTTTLHVAAPEGVVFSSSVALGDLTLAYCFEGAGSVAFKGAVSGGAHMVRDPFS